MTQKQILGLGKVLFFLILFIALSIIVPIPMSLIPWGESVHPLFIFGIANFLLLLSITLLIWIFRHFIDKKDFMSLGLDTKNFFKDFVVGGGIAITILSLGFIIMLLAHFISIESTYIKWSNILISVFIWIVIALIEELSIRGYVLTNLMEHFNKYCALIISSSIFSLVHFFNGNFTILSSINIFLAGILLGMIYIYTRNLWAPIGLHFFWNLSQAFLGFNVSGGEYPVILVLKFPSKNIFNGGDFGFEGSIICTLITLVGIVIIWRYQKKKHLDLT